MRFFKLLNRSHISCILLVTLLLGNSAIADMKTANEAYAKEDYKTAFDEYLKEAKAGNPEAQSKIGIMYFWGRGTFRSDSYTYTWSLKAAKQGHKNAQHMVGYLYENGIYVEKDIHSAIDWYRKSAAQDYPPAQANLAGIYMFSEDIPTDLDRAFRFAQKAAFKHNKHAEYLMGYYYQHKNSDYHLARKWYTIAAKNGNADAANLLGKFHFNGIDVKQDFKKAFFWFRIAERSDSAEGLINRERAQVKLKNEEVIELEKSVDQWFIDVEKEKAKNKKVDKLKAMREILELEDI